MAAAPTKAVAIYPGSFDPITNGHLDLIGRGARLFDRLIVAILRNDTKEPLFSAAERMEMARELVTAFERVTPNRRPADYTRLLSLARGGTGG